MAESTIDLVSEADKGVTAAIVSRMTSFMSGGIPSDARTLGKQCLLDWFSVALAGGREPLVQMLIGQAEDDGCLPVATVLGSNKLFSSRQAALINGAMGHAIDYDDTVVAGLGHMTAATLPAALAVAETHGRSGRQLLDAFVAGYEAAVMVGIYVGMAHYDRGFHGTGTIGTFGAASAAALLLELGPDACARALGIAGTQAAGLKGQFGTMCKPLHAGKASENGLFSAQLAQRGFTGRADLLECLQGFAHTHSPERNAEASLASPPSGAHIAGNLFKFSAACYGTHGAIIGVRALLEKYRFSIDEIRRVELRVEPGADAMCNVASPQTGLQAKFSLRFNAALSLAGENTAAPETYTDAVVQRSDLCALRDRVVVRPMHKGWPMCLTEIDIELSDGRVLQGSFDTGVPPVDIHDQGLRLKQKFDALVIPLLGISRAEELSSALSGIDDISDVRDLLALVR